MNILLPRKQFTLQVAAPRKEVVRRLAYQVEVPKYRWRSHHHRPYQGDVSSHSFNIRRIIHYRNSFLPIIKGKFEEQSGKTQISISIELHPFVLGFASLWILGWYGFSIAIASQEGLSNPTTVVFLIAPILLFSVFAIAFWMEAKRAESDLKAIFFDQYNTGASPTKTSPSVANIILPITIGLSALIGMGIFFSGTIPSPPPVENNSAYSNLQLLHDLEGVQATAIAISPDLQWVATGGNDKTIRLWDIKTSEQIKSLSSPSGEIQFLEFTPDNEKIISGSKDRTIRVWDIKSSQLKHTINIGNVYLSDIELSQDGETLISSSGGANVQAWNVETGEPQVIATANYRQKSFGGIKFTENSYINDIALSPDGKTLAIAEGELFLQNLKTSHHFKLCGNEYWNRIRTVKFTNAGNRLIGATEKHLKIWNTDNNRILSQTAIAHWNESIEKIDISKDGRFAAILITQKRPKLSSKYQIFDLNTQKILARVEALSGDIKLSADGNYIINSDGNHLKIWARDSHSRTAIDASHHLRAFDPNPSGQNPVITPVK